MCLNDSNVLYIFVEGENIRSCRHNLISLESHRQFFYASLFTNWENHGPQASDTNPFTFLYFQHCSTLAVELTWPPMGLALVHPTGLTKTLRIFSQHAVDFSVILPLNYFYVWCVFLLRFHALRTHHHHHYHPPYHHHHHHLRLHHYHRCITKGFLLIFPINFPFLFTYSRSLQLTYSSSPIPSPIPSPISV